jgi:hypothetical protein
VACPQSSRRLHQEALEHFAKRGTNPLSYNLYMIRLLNIALAFTLTSLILIMYAILK